MFFFPKSYSYVCIRMCNYMYILIYTDPRTKQKLPKQLKYTSWCSFKQPAIYENRHVPCFFQEVCFPHVHPLSSPKMEKTDHLTNRASLGPYVRGHRNPCIASLRWSPALNSRLAPWKTLRLVTGFAGSFMGETTCWIFWSYVSHAQMINIYIYIWNK